MSTKAARTFASPLWAGLGRSGPVDSGDPPLESPSDEGTSPLSRMLKPSSFSMPAISLSCWARNAAAGSSSPPTPLPAAGAFSMSKSSMLRSKTKTVSERKTEDGRAGVEVEAAQLEEEGRRREGGGRRRRRRKTTEAKPSGKGWMGQSQIGKGDGWYGTANQGVAPFKLDQSHP